MTDEIDFKKIELQECHCVKCGKLLGKLRLIVGKIIIEIKCYNCNHYNTIYLEKKNLTN